MREREKESERQLHKKKPKSQFSDIFLFSDGESGKPHGANDLGQVPLRQDPGPAAAGALGGGHRRQLQGGAQRPCSPAAQLWKTRCKSFKLEVLSYILF